MCYDRDRADGHLTARLSHAALFARRLHLRKAVQKKRESGGNEVFHQEVGKEEGEEKGWRGWFGGFFFFYYSQGGSGQPEGAGEGSRGGWGLPRGHSPEVRPEA